MSQLRDEDRRRISPSENDVDPRGFLHAYVLHAASSLFLVSASERVLRFLNASRSRKSRPGMLPTTVVGKGEVVI